MEKGVMANSTDELARRNKANSSITDWGRTCGGTAALQPTASGLRRAKCVKRTQFAPGEVGPWLEQVVRNKTPTTKVGASRNLR